VFELRYGYFLEFGLVVSYGGLKVSTNQDRNGLMGNALLVMLNQLRIEVFHALVIWRNANVGLPKH
jgi:hypothetical protein